MPKILNIVETAYRGTIEEQDDTILWLSHNLKNKGADISILLRANAVNYAVKGQDASGLTFGDAKMAHPPEIDKDVEKMINKGITVYLVQEGRPGTGPIGRRFHIRHQEGLAAGFARVDRSIRSDLALVI